MWKECQWIFVERVGVVRDGRQRVRGSDLEEVHDIDKALNITMIFFADVVSASCIIRI
jgi:hypothetical protein